MVAAGLVQESVGGQCTYSLTAQTAALLERTPDNRMERFEQIGKRLIGEKNRSLELGSTILFYYRQDPSGDWNEALRKACDFKSVSFESADGLESLELAKKLAV